MASSNDNLSFSVDLDSAEFVSGANAALESIKKLGAEENLSGLISGLEKAGLAIGALGAAYFAVKVAFDAVFDAEEIQAVNAQFEIFTRNAGVLSSTLKEGLISAAHGWETETELLKSANKALVELETGADKLPQIMDLARKASAVMGGTITENFDLISRAIATGSTRMLRQLGIIVDQQKAYMDYATSIGATVDSLSKAGQQQAILNAILAQGEKKLGDVDTSIKPVTTAWKEFKTALKEVGESIDIIINKMFGGAFKSGMTWLKDSFHALNVTLKQNSGEGLEGMANKSEYLSGRIGVLREKMIDLHDAVTRNQKAMKGGNLEAELSYRQNLELLQKTRQEYTALLKQNSTLQAQMKKGRQEEKEDVDKKISPKTDPAKVAAQEAAYKKELAALDEKLVQDHIKRMSTEAQADNLYYAQQRSKVDAYKAQIDEVNAKEQKGQLTSGQAAMERLKIQELINRTLIKDERELDQMRSKALDNYLHHSESVAQGISRAFEVSGKKMEIQMNDFSAHGTIVAGAFQSHMLTAFKEIGEGSKSATDIMKEAFFGMIGDVAAKEGEAMFLESFKFWPAWPNAQTAAGLALTTLGGAMGAISSGGASSGGIGGGSPSTGSTGTDTAAGSALSSNSSQTMPQKTTNLVINGPILGDAGTARWLTNQIRAASDSQAFTIQATNNAGNGFGG